MASNSELLIAVSAHASKCNSTCERPGVQDIGDLTGQHQVPELDLQAPIPVSQSHCGNFKRFVFIWQEQPWLRPRWDSTCLNCRHAWPHAGAAAGSDQARAAGEQSLAEAPPGRAGYFGKSVPANRVAARIHRVSQAQVQRWAAPHLWARADTPPPTASMLQRTGSRPVH